MFCLCSRKGDSVYIFTVAGLEVIFGEVAASEWRGEIFTVSRMLVHWFFGTLRSGVEQFGEMVVEDTKTKAGRSGIGVIVASRRDQRLSNCPAKIPDPRPTRVAYSATDRYTHVLQTV
jgi:hypothetical protein